MVQLKSDAVFNTIKDRLAENPAKGKQINAVFLYKITNTTSNGAPVKQWSEWKPSIFYFHTISKMLSAQLSAFSVHFDQSIEYSSDFVTIHFI